jgi:hypothetical protein
MRELEEVGESFKHTLRSMMHSRVSYPDQRTEKTESIAPSARVQAPPSAVQPRPPMTAA